jgi:hypothetical protein
MKEEDFSLLVASIKQAGEIRRGERKSTRRKTAKRGNHWFSGWSALDGNLRHPDSPGNRMSLPSMDGQAVKM